MEPMNPIEYKRTRVFDAQADAIEDAIDDLRRLQGDLSAARGPLVDFDARIQEVFHRAMKQESERTFRTRGLEEPHE